MSESTTTTVARECHIDYLPMFQNVAAFWTETGLYRFATPRFYTIDDFPESRRDLRSESLYPSPWQGGWWRLRDAVEYMLTASVAVLDYAAKYREQLLYNRYRAGRDTIEKYRHQPPYAYFVPRRQRDPVAAAELVRRLAFNGLRIYELTAEATFGCQGPRAGDLGRADGPERVHASRHRQLGRHRWRHDDWRPGDDGC